MTATSASTDAVILLGRRDIPTDGVSDYSRLLCSSLQRRGRAIRLVRAPWDELGWRRAMVEMREQMALCSPAWVLMQYTHLMWSLSGFPLRALDIARTIRRMNSRLAVVIHDPIGFPGARLIDRVRRRAQHATMRALCRLADATIVTVASDRVPWCGKATRVRCIPVGPNIVPCGGDPGPHGTFTVSVFGVTGGRADEVLEIAHVARQVARELGQIQLVVLGRGSR
ncbi:MAG: hypothetical protein ACRDGM_14465, partial [bacterium]